MEKNTKWEETLCVKCKVEIPPQYTLCYECREEKNRDDIINENKDELIEDLEKKIEELEKQLDEKDEEMSRLTTILFNIRSCFIFSDDKKRVK